MEDKYLVAKTLLECYPHLDELYESLTRRSEAAVKSGFYAIFPSEQMRIYERIIECEERKVGLYNMKYLIEESFRRGNSAALSLLKEKYIDNLSKEELMRKYGVCLRTCYRYMRRGIADFTAALEKLGFDKKRLLLTFGNEPMFQNMLAKVIRADDMEAGALSLPAEEEGAERKEVNRHSSPRRPDTIVPAGSGVLAHSGAVRPYV